MKVTDFDLIVVKREGKKKSINIAQIKEIRKIIFDELLKIPAYDMWRLLEKGRGKGGK